MSDLQTPTPAETAAPTPPATLAEALTALFSAWNTAWAFPGGPRALHLIFGIGLQQGQGDYSGGLGISTKLNGEARQVTDKEIAEVPKLIAQAEAGE